MPDVTLTVNLDKTASLDRAYLAIQGEQISIDAELGTGLEALGYDGYIDFLQADGVAYFKGPYDCSTGTVSFTLGASDSILDKDGIVYCQMVLAETVGSVRTIKWLSQKVKTLVMPSVLATSAAILPYVPQMVFPADYPAENITLADVDSRFTAEQVEAALAELAGSGRTTETVKANATSIGTLASLSTTTKTNLVVAVNEVDGHADTANTSIGTLASLTTTEKTTLVGAVNEVDKRFDDQTIVGYDSTHNGKIKLDNGYMRIWGEFACASMASDGGTGGYSTTINLNDTFTGNPIGYATFRYASGGAYAYTHSISTTQIKIGSNVNVAGAYVGWCVEGKWN